MIESFSNIKNLDLNLNESYNNDNLNTDEEKIIRKLFISNSANHCSYLTFKIMEYAFDYNNKEISIEEMKNKFVEKYKINKKSLLTTKYNKTFKNVTSLKATITNCIQNNRKLFTQSIENDKETFSVNISKHVH